jgi:hypothetical protein
VAIGPTRSTHCFFWATSVSVVEELTAMRMLRPLRSGVGDSGSGCMAAPCGLEVYSAAAVLHGKQSGSASP